MAGWRPPLGLKSTQLEAGLCWEWATVRWSLRGAGLAESREAVTSASH